MPSPVATPSSTSACASEPPGPARPRDEREPVGRDEPGRLEQVGDELGELVDAGTLAGRRGVAARRPASSAPDSPDGLSVSGRSRSIESLE